MAKTDGETEVREAIAAMPDWERAVGEGLHEAILESAPELTPKLWYRQPAYAKGGKNGKVVCFFRGAELDGERYVTFGFTGEAVLDDGKMWATSFALTGLGPAEKKEIAALVSRAAG
jgi:uncharacterized protein YdhG (YjbR/CyaY superfamily)